MLNGALISDRKPVSSKGGNGMTTKTEKLAAEIQNLTDVEKIRLADEILSDLDKPDPEIDRIWAEEARKRWTAYKAGHIPSVSYREVMDKYRRS
jgi:putative addiction module component (TIGR02574 family)